MCKAKVEVICKFLIISKLASKGLDHLKTHFLWLLDGFWAVKGLNNVMIRTFFFISYKICLSWNQSVMLLIKVSKRIESEI